MSQAGGSDGQATRRNAASLRAATAPDEHMFILTLREEDMKGQIKGIEGD